MSKLIGALIVSVGLIAFDLLASWSRKREQRRQD